MEGLDCSFFSKRLTIQFRNIHTVYRDMSCLVYVIESFFDLKCCSPLKLCAPQNVLFAIHDDREMLVFTLLDRVGAGCDGTHLSKLETQGGEVLLHK